MPNTIIGILLLWQEIANLKGSLPDIRWGKMFLIFLSIASLQFIYYYLATGHFFVWSYGSEGFSNWMHPEVLNILFSVRKGLFFWYPVLLLSVPGFILMSRGKMVLQTVIFLVVITYITASWWFWPYGGSFGMRPYVDILAVFSIPLAATLNRFQKIVLPLMIISVAFTVLMMLLYWLRIIPFDGFQLSFLYAAS